MTGPRRPGAQRLALPLALGFVIALFSVIEPETFPTAANLRTILGSQAVLVLAALLAGVTLSRLASGHPSE